MGQNNPWLLVGMLIVTGLMARWWRDDYRANLQGQPHPRALPGATPTNGPALLLAVSGTMLLLVAETVGEHTLGLSEQQSHMTVLYGFITLAAAFFEELIFRGYLVVTQRGRATLVISILAASLGFALLHPFLWAWKDGRMTFNLGMKAWFSTTAIFAGSLWFYFLRFMSLNPTRSLIPCITAHAVKNLGVFAIKYAQGFVSDWW